MAATTSIEAGNLFKVDGLVAVITGGGSGIGLMMARALALNGAHKVYIVGRRKDVLVSAASSVDTNNIIPIVGDVTSQDSLQSVANQIRSDVGYVNVVVANSGSLGPQAKVTPSTSLKDFKDQFWKTPFQEYTDVFGVNVSGVWYTALAFLELLDEGNKKGNLKQHSQIIVTSSIGGFNRKAPGGFVYGQSKAAVTHMAKQLSTNLIPYHIRCNALAPGLYPSELAQPILVNFQGDIPKEQVPAERLGEQEDMAGAILYLTSRAGGYLNGNILVTDGGRLATFNATY